MWPADVEMQYFFCTPAWGVTTAWLRQYTQRLVRHFASFTGEAAVHRAAAARAGNLDDVPDEARKKLRRAWLTWRIVVRTHQRYAAEGDIIPEKKVDLSLDPSDLAVSVSPWYEDFMLHRRINRRPRDYNSYFRWECEAASMESLRPTPGNAYADAPAWEIHRYFLSRNTREGV